MNCGPLSEITKSGMPFRVVTLQLSYTCGCFGISEPVNFPEIGEIVHSNEIILVVKIADVYCDFFPWPVSGLKAHQCFLGLLN